MAVPRKARGTGVRNEEAPPTGPFGVLRTRAGLNRGVKGKFTVVQRGVGQIGQVGRVGQVGLMGGGGGESRMSNIEHRILNGEVEIGTHSTAPSTSLGTWLRAGLLAMTVL